MTPRPPPLPPMTAISFEFYPPKTDEQRSHNAREISKSGEQVKKQRARKTAAGAWAEPSGSSNASWPQAIEQERDLPRDSNGTYIVYITKRQTG